MQAGRLRDRVVILNATTVRSPSGHPVGNNDGGGNHMGRS